jgi:hypothetical protein
VVGLAGSWGGNGAVLLGDSLHVAEAWAAARLFPRVQSLALGVILFWCTAGAAVDILGFGALLGVPSAQLVFGFASQLFSGVAGAFMAEGFLRLLPRRVRALPRETRTGLQQYFSWWAMWLLVAPGLILTLVFGRITFDEQRRRAQAESQAAAAGAAAAVAALDVGDACWSMAAGLEVAASGAGPDASALTRCAAHPVPAACAARPSGRALASSPQLAVGSAATVSPSGRGTRWRRFGRRRRRAVLLRLSMPCAANDVRRLPGGRAGGQVPGRVPEAQRRDSADLVSLKSDDGALMPRRPALWLAASGRRGVTATADPELPWSVWLDQPLADAAHPQRGGATGGRLPGIVALSAAGDCGAGAVRSPAAGGWTGGRRAGVGRIGRRRRLLDDLAASPIAEVHGLANRFTCMHRLATTTSDRAAQREAAPRLAFGGGSPGGPATQLHAVAGDLTASRHRQHLGHAGQRVLRKVGRRLQDCAGGDTVARAGRRRVRALIPRVGRMEEATDVRSRSDRQRPFLVRRTCS